MAQYGRPVADVVNENWKDQGDGTTNLYTTIDEASASDADYIKSAANPSDADAYVCDLTTSLEDPVSSSGHIMRWRRKKSATGGAAVNLTIELRMGYTDEGSMGTLIHSESDPTLPDAWTDDSYTLNAGEADSITDYTDLQLRFHAVQA